MSFSTEQDDNSVRLQTELDLLEAMYPSSIHYRQETREITYQPEPNHNTTNTLRLLLPLSYPSSAPPSVLSATSKTGRRIEDAYHKSLPDVAVGEEVLDTYIDTFNTLIQQLEDEAQRTDAAHSENSQDMAESKLNAPFEQHKTVIIWLHHLLNTNKRKQVLSPPLPLNGISKPGYPGVLIFSGPILAVDQHVRELKQLNWQAFQVRHEEDGEWVFEPRGGDDGVKEVESISDVVKAIGDDTKRKGVFMEAMRMK